MRKKVLSILIIVFLVPFVAMAIYFIYSRQQKVMGDPQVLVGSIGSERIYRKDLEEISSRKSIRGNDSIWSAIVDESLRLQYGALTGIVSLDDTSFNFPNKNYSERIKLLNRVKDPAQFPSFTLSYATHTMYFDDNNKEKITELIIRYARAYIKEPSNIALLQPITKEYQELEGSNSTIPITTTYNDVDLLDPLTPNLYAPMLVSLSDSQPSSPIYFKSTDMSGSITNGATVISLISRKVKESQNGSYYFDKFKEYAKVTKYEI